MSEIRDSVARQTSAAAPGGTGGPGAALAAAVPVPAAAAVPVAVAVVPGAGGSVWRLRQRQLAAIVRFELQKNFFGGRAIGLWLLALAPPAIFALRATMGWGLEDRSAVGTATEIMAHAYRDLLLPVIFFLGCVWIFGNLIRREVLDRSLHFYFLVPLRREVLVLGKFLTGLLAALVFFETSTIATFALVYFPYAPIERNQFLFHGGGLANLGSYILVTALACAGYGACFLALSFFFRSPAIPAIGLFGWEFIHFLLPPGLKQLSVIHYLQALCPVPVAEGPFALLSDAPSKTTSILGLLALTLALLALSTWRIRTMEIAYVDD